ncbi:MAG: Cof-type HAD-IIB family hydrolase [Prevotella sp.]|jgi:Cof subfamily protein (haloacid dehalogenase superfamily)|nr:Cof-type HAD-IIB family hydrolase [Prevotella sp.]
MIRNTNHTQKALFFDIDGTLVSFKTHRIPESTVLALTEAKRNGSKIYISTGRPIQFIMNLGQIEHLIDGYVTTNGARCFIGDKTISINAIPHNEVEILLKDAKLKDYCSIVVGVDGIGIFNEKPIANEIFVESLAVPMTNILIPVEQVLKGDILQFSPFIDKETEDKLMPQLQHCVSGRWHPKFTDITAEKADKGKGILALAQHEGFDMSNCIGFGDGGNDTTMIKDCGIGVAMGNAIPELKSIADYVTSSVDEDGIANALRHFGIID